MAAMNYLADLARRTVGVDAAIRPLLPIVYQRATRGARDAGATDVVAPYVAPLGSASDFDELAVDEAGRRLAGGQAPSARGEPPQLTPAAGAQVAARTALQVTTRPDSLLPVQLGRLRPALTVRDGAPLGDRLERRTLALSPAGAAPRDSVRIAIRPKDVRPAVETSSTDRITVYRARDQAQALASEPPALQEPTIHVHIGRIEVRAAPAPGPKAATSSQPAAKRTSLADYLSTEGRRGDSGGQP